MNEFDIRKYQNESNILVDGPSALANERDLVISFYHVPSGRSVYFKAFITAFNENYNSNFTPHEAFGRTDPIYQYKNTTRKITLAFKILAASEGEAFENLGRLSLLQQMLYPSYQDLDSATTLNQAPLIRIKVMNLLSSNFVNSEIPEADNQNPRNVFYNSYKSTKDPKLGLLGIIDNLTANHNLESEDGVFFKREEIDGVAKGVRNTILPKFIDVNISFSPIHEQTIGWKDGQPLQSLFPYGIVSDQTSFGRALQSAVYDRRVELEKQEKIRQQQVDNARARYGGVLGDLRLKADTRRGLDGNENAKARLRGRAAALEEDMEARIALTELITSDFLETP